MKKKCFLSGIARITSPPPSPQFGQLVPLFLDVKNDVLVRITELNSEPKLPFPGNGKGNYKMPRGGKGNLRLVFPGITENGNSRSPLWPSDDDDDDN